jgi:hypothetical protein
VDVTIVIHYDKISNILLVNQIYHVKTKQIEAHYHFVKNKVLAKEINFVHVNVKDQIANIFTKVLSIDKLLKSRSMVGVLDHMWT